MTALVRLDRAAGVATVTLDDPGRRNAIGQEMAGQLVEICDLVDADESIGALVLQGAGGYFCSGGRRDELALISDAPYAEQSRELLDSIYSAFLRVGSLRVPTISAVTGGAIGAGFNLVLATDVRVVAQDAVLASGFPSLGVHPGGGHLTLLGRADRQAAVAMGVLDSRIDGRRALELGLAWAAPPADEAAATAQGLARVAAANPQLARQVRASVSAELDPPGATWSAAVELERGPQLRSFARKGGSGWRAESLDNNEGA